METALQNYLRNKGTIDTLKEEYGINAVEHPDLPLVSFKYSMIDTGTVGAKTDPVVRAARGTVLEKGTWNLVAQPFFRFFNYGEFPEEQKNFQWNSCVAATKEDGSLMIVYFYNGEWHVNTSGSFGLSECGFSNLSWRELFWQTSEIDGSQLDPDVTYIFELCTIWNKVVRLYSTPRVYLLGAINRETLHDYHFSEVQAIGDDLGVMVTNYYGLNSYEEVKDFLDSVEEKDPTFEGLVLRDSNDVRIKVKTKTYLALHHMADNGNIGNPKNIIPFVLAGEVDEVITYFPELEDSVKEIEETLNAEFENLVNIWEEAKDIADQKQFALEIIPRTKFSGLLFKARKTGEDLSKLWRDSADTIHKTLYK